MSNTFYHLLVEFEPKLPQNYSTKIGTFKDQSSFFDVLRLSCFARCESCQVSALFYTSQVHSFMTCGFFKAKPGLQNNLLLRRRTWYKFITKSLTIVQILSQNEIGGDLST